MTNRGSAVRVPEANRKGIGRVPREARVYVAGHRGLVGRAILDNLKSSGFTNLVTRPSDELDLRDQAKVEEFFESSRPDYVILAAARVGGILANSTYPAEFLYDNLLIAANVIHASYRHDVKKLLNLGSSCIYPRMAPQPLKEEYLLTGPLEETNRAYAIAKIAAIELCDSYRKQFNCDFVSAMPTNLYGPGDNFDLQSSHVLPALIRKMHEAKVNGRSSVSVWGTGEPRREFLYVNDLADACLFILDHVSASGPINVGTGSDICIRELAQLIKEVVDFRGRLEYDTTKPDGTPRKLMETSRLAELGWSASTGLREGISRTYEWFTDNS